LITSWFAIAFVALGVIVASLFNLLWTYGIRHEARRSVEAAALAAGQAWLTDDLLRLQQAPFETEGRMTSAAEAAVRLSQDYATRTSVPVLSFNDVQCRMPAAAESASRPLIPDAIHVAFGSRQPATTIPLFFAGLTGRESAVLGVSARVILECTPVGFSPGERLPVPMLPFAILDDAVVSSAEATAPADGCWTHAIERGNGLDQYTWIPDSHQFAPGPDGLPELTVTLDHGESAGDDALIPLTLAASEAGRTAPVSNWIHTGLTRAGLASLGMSQWSYSSLHPRALVPPQDQDTIQTALDAHIAEPLIVSLCTLADVPSPDHVRLTRPVAVRIIRVGTSVGGRLRVTVQPCVLSTATAIMSPEPTVTANRYVYCVRLLP
jgi:hypothetical protein